MNVTPLDFEKPILELTKKLDDLKRHLRGQEIDSDPEVRRIAAHIEKDQTSGLRQSQFLATCANRPTSATARTLWITCDCASRISPSCMGTAFSATTAR